MVTAAITIIATVTTVTVTTNTIATVTTATAIIATFAFIATFATVVATECRPRKGTGELEQCCCCTARGPARATAAAGRYHDCVIAHLGFGVIGR